jgi:hypothetical protein
MLIAILLSWVVPQHFAAALAKFAEQAIPLPVPHTRVRTGKQRNRWLRWQSSFLKQPCKSSKQKRRFGRTRDIVWVEGALPFSERSLESRCTRICCRYVFIFLVLTCTLGTAAAVSTELGVAALQFATGTLAMWELSRLQPACFRCRCFAAAVVQAAT